MVALFPFKRFVHGFVIMPHHPFDPERERRANETLRRNIQKLKEQVRTFVDPSDEKAVKKAKHYIRSLDVQLAECNPTDEVIARLDTVAGNFS